jgi:hypothetical protein
VTGPNSRWMTLLTKPEKFGEKSIETMWVIIITVYGLSITVLQSVVTPVIETSSRTVSAGPKSFADYQNASIQPIKDKFKHYLSTAVEPICGDPLKYWSSRPGDLARMACDFISCPGMLSPLCKNKETDGPISNLH